MSGTEVLGTCLLVLAVILLFLGTNAKKFNLPKPNKSKVFIVAFVFLQTGILYSGIFQIPGLGFIGVLLFLVRYSGNKLSLIDSKLLLITLDIFALLFLFLSIIGQ